MVPVLVVCCRYKAAKAELAANEAELLVLSRTQQVLGGQHADALAKLDAVERERGVQGYTDTQVGACKQHVATHMQSQ